jgi:uncharacterized membrane protein
MKNRLKSYPLWVAVFAFVPMISDALGFYNISLPLPGNYEKLVVAFMGILVLAGLLNNPSSGTGYKDGEE